MFFSIMLSIRKYQSIDLVQSEINPLPLKKKHRRQNIDDGEIFLHYLKRESEKGFRLKEIGRLLAN